MGTILTPIDSFDSVVSPNPYEPVKASASTGFYYIIVGLDVNGGVVYTSNAAGVRVRHLGGVSQTLAVTVVGSDITVQLGTNAGGGITSTANNVVAAVTGATALVTALAQGTGNGLAGVNTSFMPLTDDPFGSIRPGLQSLTNIGTWLKNGIVSGTRSLAKVFVDGVGAASSAVPAGEMWATVAIQSALAAAQGLRMEVARLIYRHTLNGSADANPATNVALKNELRALTLTKCFGNVVTDGAGGIASTDGASFTATISAGKVLITMLTAMDNNSYTVLPSIEGSAFAHPTVFWQYVSTTQFFILGQNNGVDISPSTTIVRFGFEVLGRQTTT